METLNPQGGTSFDPMVSRIDKDYQTLLHTKRTKYICCGPHGFRIFPLSVYKNFYSPGWGQFLANGQGWQVLRKRPLVIAS